MNYPQALSYLFAQHPSYEFTGASAYKPGLAHIRALLARLGNPHERLRAIHVAGTNGKGSTAHLLASALQASGRKVGLYTSPHLVDFRERIRVNGKMIDEATVVHFVEHTAAETAAYPEADGYSFFELTTALAFWYFAVEGVDIAVVETGLGGRLDSTNVLPASSVLCSVITNIGLDHTELLGTSLAAIAVEKAGIMKRGVPCVIGETQGETESVFESEAERQGSPIYWADQHEYLRRFRVRYASECQLKGVYQEHNLQTAYVTLRLLQREHPELGLTREAIAEGFARVCELTGLRGRWEQVAAHPLTICDTGHNVHGLREVFAQLSDLHRRYGGVLRMVFGMVKDKDIATVRRMLPKDAVYYFCQAHTPRAVPAQMTVEEAVRQAQKDAAAEDLIFIGGSNYVVGEALPLFDAVS